MPQFWQSDTFTHIVWTGDAHGRFSVYKNGALQGSLEGTPISNIKRKYMWLARLIILDDIFLPDSTYSYIRFWQGKALGGDEAQQLYEAKDDISGFTSSPTSSPSPTAKPTTASPTTSHAPTIVDLFAPTTFLPTMTPSPTSLTPKHFVVSTFEQLQEAVALLTDNAMIEINASIVVTETLIVSGGYNNVTIKSTQGNHFSLVSVLYFISVINFVNVFAIYFIFLLANSYTYCS